MPIAAPARAANPSPRRFLRRWTRVGAAANLVLVAAMVTAWAYAQPLFDLGDEMAHLDYAYQIWQGRWPVFEAGLQLRPPFGVRAPVQWTSQHPPLYYLIQAPFVGPWLSADNILVAGYVGRAVNGVIAVALVGAIMWTTSAIVLGRTVLWLASGTVAALYPVVVETGGTMYSDLLLALLATLLIGLTARMVRRGPSTRRLVLFALAAAGALLSRSAGGPIIAGCCAVLIAVFLLRPRRGHPWHGWRGIAGVLGAGVLAVLASGWFYLRNLALTGNLAGGRFGYLTHRVTRPLSEVLTAGEVWAQLLAIHGYLLVDNVVASVLLVGLPITAAAVLGIRHLVRERRLVPDLALAVLLTGLTGGIVLMRLLFVAAGGGASMRYLAPVTVVVTLGVAAGLTAARRIAPLLLSAWVSLAFVPYASYLAAFLAATPLPREGPVFAFPTVVALVVAAGALFVLVAIQFALAGWFNDVIRLAPPTHAPTHAPRRALVGDPDGPA